VAQIDTDIASTEDELKEKLPMYKLLGKQERAQLAPTVTPIVKKLVGLWEERQKASISAAEKSAAAQEVCMNLAILSALDDPDATTRLDAMAKSDVKLDAARAKVAQGLVGWWTNFGNQQKQNAAFDDIVEAGKTAESAAAEAAVIIVNCQNLSHEQEKRIRQYGVDHLKTPQMAPTRKEWQDVLARLALEGKPMTITGRTVEGRDFSSAQWKGKVVVVDFWASWCGPCKEEMPRTISLYQKYHDKGLEIIGVSCDQTAGDLRQYVQANSGMAWPQLFVPSSNGDWHPLTKRFNVNSIPTLFIIDKSGVCRTVQGRTELDALVPQLLAEPVAR
jgi:thiol-disulfide isomerase/thioredoxin